MEQNNRKKTANTSDTTGVEQPLMSTGTTEPGFDWGTNRTELAAKPKIGETLVGEDNTKD
ncbi:hypothetical protein [Priestia abyssalis]|uniref:hypothetical protein n=1 Tax=Priestia abyssalis TaxID=1221450 RepID=UPI0009957F65|nr:hypothetical protein [Priestia abyssalis]